MDPSHFDDYRWLVSDEAIPILKETRESFKQRVNALSIAKRLRKTCSPSRSALLMEQAQLQIRAARKFELSDSMFFTRKGLEQASSWRIAEYKADRYAAFNRVADICCGIGGDLIALANQNSHGCTFGVDSDPLTCLFAEKNLVANDVNATILEEAVESLVDPNWEAIHVDPDRRVGGRTVVGNRFSPTLDAIHSKFGIDRAIGIKVAPATSKSNFVNPTMEREWIGDHRECKQQVIWTGELVRNPGCRTATYVGKRGVSRISVPEDETLTDYKLDSEFRRYIFEPHSSVLAAGLTDTLSRKYQIRRFAKQIVYLTGDEPISDPLLTQFEIIEVLPMDLRLTSRLLNALDVGEIEVKKRGVVNVVADRYSRMKLQGPNKATIILTRFGKSGVTLVTRRKGNSVGQSTPE
ncbi:MAG: hypothetical protein AAF623_05375 [Planctomycetota bacterium]